MGNSFSDVFDNAKVEAGKLDIDDILSFGNNYFKCGYKPKDDPEGCYYNHNISIAFAIIGKLYCPLQRGVSNYHKGIAYIAKELNLSKRQIKVLRKKYSVRDGYVFKTPYTIHVIISKMIDLLSAKGGEPIMMEYLQQRNSDLYREILIAKQYAAIMAASPFDKKVNDVYGELQILTTKVR